MRKARKRIRGWRIAAQRSAARKGLIPSLRRAQLFKIVDWNGIGVLSGDYEALGDFALKKKFESVRYFLTKDDIEWFRDNDPFASHAQAIQQADEIIAGKVPLAGRESVSVGTRIPWTVDPMSGKNIWEATSSFRPRRDLDTRFSIELNLHRHFATLARAGLITGEPKYAAYLKTQWSQWLRSNPPIDEEYISDGLELALRAVVWTHCVVLLGEQGFGRPDALRMLALIGRYGLLIERQCAANTNRNNHLAAEAFGLFFIGIMYPELKAASRWRTMGLAVLEQASLEQFSPDGVHKEEALGYQLFVTELLLLAVLLAGRNGVPLPSGIRDRLDRCAEFLYCLSRPDGSFPQYGDEGMPLFSPTGRTGIEPTRVLMLLEAVTGMKAPASTRPPWAEEEKFWFVGRQVLTAAQTGVDRNAANPIARSFGGHIVLGIEGAHVHFDCSPHGMGKRAGHGHDDALNVDYFAAGVPWLADAGTYTYMREGPYREYFANACAHSGILFNGQGAGLLVKSGSFGWLRKADAEVLGFGQTAGYVWGCGRHLGGTAPSAVPFPIVERYIVLTAKGWLLVVDAGSIDQPGMIDSLLHMHPHAELEQRAAAPLFRASGHTLRVSSQCSVEQDISFHRGGDSDLPGWYSPAYGVILPTWVVRLRARVHGTFWRATLLAPDTDSENEPELKVVEQAPGVLVCSLGSRAGEAYALNIDRNARTVSAVDKVH